MVSKAPVEPTGAHSRPAVRVYEVNESLPEAAPQCLATPKGEKKSSIISSACVKRSAPRV